jgi:hypothetical protein
MIQDGSAWTKFLDYGALGLAGMMLVLAVFALYGGLSPAKERLLRQFLYVGAFCFVVAMLPQFLPKPPHSEHLIHFRVEPLAHGANPTLPPPIITINSQRLVEMSYLVKSEVTAIVDVTDAVETAKNLRETALGLQQVATNQDRVLAELSADIDAALVNLQQSAGEVVSGICPGGSSGRPPAAGPRIAGKINSVTSTLSGAQSAIQAVRTNVTP